jgi:hypothetical protein
MYVDLNLHIPERQRSCVGIWNDKYKQLKAYIAQGNKPDIPNTHPVFGEWLRAQREAYENGTLSLKRINLLEDLGVRLEPCKRRQWMETYRELQAYVAEGNNPNVPSSHPAFGRWLTQQRQDYKADTLLPDRVSVLEELGVHFKPRKYSHWIEMYPALQAYVDEGNNPNVPMSHPVFGMWLSNQRGKYHNGTLLPRRAALLEKLGVVWHVYRAWDDVFAEYEAYVKAGNRPNVRRDHPTLGIWFQNQCAAYRRGELRPERAEKLQALGARLGSPRRALNA